MADAAVAAALLFAGGTHLVPLVGLLGGKRLQSLYGLGPLPTASLRLVLRHRAVLFGLLGVPMVVAAAVPAWQPAAVGAGLVSAGSFLLLSWAEGGGQALTPQLQRVVRADLAVVAVLASAGLLLTCR